jgi:hypothetical protein
MSWLRYVQLQSVNRLPHEGRELLGKEIHITVKRDGENVPLRLDENDQTHISSHNFDVAENDIQNRMKAVPEYKKAIELLLDEKHQWHTDCILYGELLKEISPTRIEPKRVKTHWILFDIFNRTEGKFMNYTAVYQKAYHFKIPVVALLDVIAPKSLDELNEKIAGYLKWCKTHKKEGIVGKCYNEGIFFKEKIDLPKRPKLIKPNKSDIEYPPMPYEKVLRALQHSYDELGEENYKNKVKAMPIIARHFNAEAQEHYYKVPSNLYSHYINIPIEQIRAKPQTEEKSQ